MLSKGKPLWRKMEFLTLIEKGNVNPKPWKEFQFSNYCSRNRAISIALRRKKKKAKTIGLRALTQNRTVKLLSPECNPSNITTQGTTNLAVAKQKEARRGKKRKISIRAWRVLRNEIEWSNFASWSCCQVQQRYVSSDSHGHKKCTKKLDAKTELK
jgi:hypothetical protein